MALSTCLLPKVSTGSLGTNGTSFLPSKHGPFVCRPKQHVQRPAVVRSAGDAAKQISRRSREPPVGSAGRAACLLAALLELSEQPGLIQLSAESPAYSSQEHSPAASLPVTGELKFPWKKN